MRALALALALLSGCATLAAATIEDRLAELGLPERRAACVADELDARLGDEDMTRLARHAVTLSRSDGPGEVLDALAGVDDLGIAAAVVASGTACLFSAR